MPHAFYLSDDGRIGGYDKSYPQPIDPPWMEVTEEQFEFAQSLTSPKWTGTEIINDPPVEPTLEDQYLLQATALFSNPDCQESISGVLQALQVVVSLGIDITDWSFQGVTAAAQSAIVGADLARKIDIIQAALALRTAWDRVVYHTGDMKTADILWPYFFDLAT